MGLLVGVEPEDLAKLESDRTWPKERRPALGEDQPATAEKLCHRTLAVAMPRETSIDWKRNKAAQWSRLSPRSDQQRINPATYGKGSSFAVDSDRPTEALRDLPVLSFRLVRVTGARRQARLVAIGSRTWADECLSFLVRSEQRKPRAARDLRLVRIKIDVVS